MAPLPTRTLLRLHRYVGLLAAPLVFFFAISGIWQVYRLQDTKKDGSYTAPRSLAEASKLHKVERLQPGPAASAYRVAVSATSALIAVSAVLGVIVALRITRPRWLVVACLGGGAAIPLLLYLLAAR